MKKRNPKKLTLSKESIIRLDPTNLRDIVGGVTRFCTNTDDCTDSCAPYTICLC